MNAAINWMIKKATVETFDDGATNYSFNGHLPSKMIQNIIKVAQASRTVYGTATYSWGDESEYWYITIGGTTNSPNYVAFSYYKA